MLKTVLVLAVAAVMLAAAGSASTKSETIVLSGWPESDPATATLESVIASFEAAHPDIHVDYRPLANYTGDIEAAFAAGAPPDVLYIDSSLAPDWIAHGYLQPLHGFATKSGFETSHFFPVLRHAFEGPGGQPYGFPKDWSPLALWTNDALVPTAPTTWTQLRTTAQQLTVMQQTSLVYSIHPMPANVRRGNLAFTVAYAIASSSQHKQAAWELLSYLTGRIGMQGWVNGAAAQPSRDDVTPVPGTEMFQAEAPIATVWQFGFGFNNAVTRANSELGNVFAGTESIDEMLADFKAALGG